ncbi:MAG: heat shock protein 90 [Candidatus Methanolliviera sp. GoM_oil]|nr:MAG: heat shock protein 90 [Candidatus Methanolliviera sp. GoM_oil]
MEGMTIKSTKMSRGIEIKDFFELLKVREKEEGNETTLSATVKNVAKQAGAILSRIPVIFEEYTLHDISHSENVIKNMWKFIPEEVKAKLNALEIYLLILSAYLHDVGMAVSKDEEDKILKSEEFLKFRDKHEREVDLIEKYKEEGNTRAAEFYEKQIFMDYIREHHHERSYDYIMNNYNGEKGLKIDDESHARVIAKICRAHRLDIKDLEDKSKFDRDYSLEGNFINLQFLAVCLRLGDTLDADKRRAPKILKEFINPRNPTSKQEWEKHLSVPEVGITEEKIKINATCKSPRYQRGLLELVRKVENEREDIIRLLKDNPPAISDKYYLTLKGVEQNIETDGTYIYNDFKFSLDNDKIFNLFMGTSLYTEKTVALRELLQNSIDACRCRKAKEAEYEGKISYQLVKENTDEGEIRKIIVKDNGVGMDDYVIENYFMRIGESYYQSRDFKKEGIQFSTISVFGIGILSCFMMADKIEVETLKEGREPRKVEIENYSDYFVTRKGSRTELGTTITLFLKEDVEVDLIDKLKVYARHVEFPVYIDDGENAETIVDQGYDFNFVDYMNPLYKQYADELNPYVIDFEKEGLEGVKGKLIFMFLKDENGGYGFESKNLLLSKLSSAGEELFGGSHWGYEVRNPCFLSQDGILIKKIERLEFPFQWIDPTFIFFDVNLEGESKIDLAIDRNDVVTNSKFNNLKPKIEKIIIDHIKKIFSQKHLVTDRDKNRFMEHFFGVFSEHPIYIRTLSDFFFQSMKKLIRFGCSVNGGIKYLTYDELKDRWEYFSFIELRGHLGIIPENMKNVIEKAYSEDPIIYSVIEEKLPEILREFSGDHIIVTNKELGFSLNKYLLVSSAEKRDKKKKEYGFTFEGDYKGCFGTLTTEGFQIAPNINHPFMRLVSKNIDTFKAMDKKKYEFFIEKLLRMFKFRYLMPLKEIQRIQKYLLDFYVEKGILTKEEAEIYVLTEKDFCPYDMGEDFLKQ